MYISPVDRRPVLLLHNSVIVLSLPQNRCCLSVKNMRFVHVPCCHTVTCNVADPKEHIAVGTLLFP